MAIVIVGFNMMAGIFIAWAWACLLSQKLLGENPEIKQVFESILDDKLDHLVHALKRRIPMAGAFLSGKLEQELKLTAKDEIGGMLPELKQKFFGKVQIRQLKLKGLVLGAVIGAFSGILQLMFLRLVS